MIMTDNAAAALEPFNVDRVRDVSGNPHQKDQDHADREREAEIVVGIFRPLRPGREGFGPDRGATAACRKLC